PLFRAHEQETRQPPCPRVRRFRWKASDPPHRSTRRDTPAEGRDDPARRRGTPFPVPADVRAVSAERRPRFPRAVGHPLLGCRRAALSRPSPVAGLLGAAGWLVLAAFLTPF